MCRNVPSRPSTTARYDTSPGPTESTRSCPSTGPRRSVGPSGSIARTSAFRLTPQSERQRGIAASASGGTPSTVTPETDADGPALAVSRTTGRTVSTPGTASKRASGAAWRTGTSALRFSRTTTSAGTANAAWSCSPVESVERYAAARHASASARARKAAAVPAAPGDRASETPASRAPRAPPAARERASEGRQQTCGRDGGGERDEAGQDEEHDRRSAARGELVRLNRAAREDGERRQRGSDRGDVDRGDLPSASAVDRDGHRDHAGGATAVPRPSRRPVGESRLSVSTSQTGAPEAAATIAPAMMPDHPADDRAAEADGGALGPGQKRPLPRLRAVPGQPPPCGREIAAHGACREDGEGDEERGRLATDEQQPPAGDGRGALRFAQLLRRQRDRPGGRVGLQRRARPIGAGEEPVDLPEPRRPCLQRLHPAVAPIRPGEDGRRDEARDALGHDERCGGRAVVRRGAPESRSDLGILERVVGWGEEVAEELPRAQGRGPDLHDPQAGHVGEPARAAQAEHLAAIRPAGARQPAASQHDVRPEAVDGREPDEGPADRALADERDCRRVARRQGRERIARGPVETAPVVGRPRRNAEPHRTDSPRRRREPVDVLRDRAVLRDRRPREDQREHRRRCRDPERRNERAAFPAPEALAGEREDVSGSLHRALPAAWRRR